MTLDDGRLERAWALAREYVEAGSLETAGLGVASSSGTTSRLFSAPGQPDLSDRHLFLLASISKPITGLAIMRLVEQGRLVLSQPIQQIIPEFAAPGKPDVTAWHLMTHTSGLPDLPWERAGQEDYAEAALLAHSFRATAQFRPGARWQYNTLTFYLLGELVRRLDGRSLEAFLREEVIGPVGISGIGLDPATLDGPAVTPQGISPNASITAEQAMRIMIGAAMPGAGFWSDMASLLGLGQTLLRDARDGQARLLARPTLDLMTTLHTGGIPKYELPSTTDGRYGLTWHKPTTLRERTLPGTASAFSHSGATGTVLWVDPEADLAVVFLTNHWGIGDDYWSKCLQAVYAAWRP